MGGNGQKDHQVSFNLHHGEKTPPNTELQGGEKKNCKGEFAEVILLVGDLLYFHDTQSSTYPNTVRN